MFNSLKKHIQNSNINNINAGTVIKWLNSVITYVQKWGAFFMTIGYARVSTAGQDLDA